MMDFDEMGHKSHASKELTAPPLLYRPSLEPIATLRSADGHGHIQTATAACVAKSL